MKEARSSSRLALVIGLVVAIIVACGPDRDDDHTESTKEGLRSNPQLSNFVVYASNSLSLMDRVQIQGGDVGVEHSGTSGPFLVTGYEAALSADSRIDTTRDLLAEDVFLRDRATVGDVEATHITNQFGVYANQYALPTMPAFPSVATPAPGTSSYSVASGQTQTLAAGAFAAVTVNGTLNLSGGTYDFASLSLGNDARLQAQGTTVLHIAGRVSTGDRAHIETTGTTLSAKDFRLEVSGQNGSTGALSASPKAFSLGNDTVVRALIIVPNGTLQTGQRTVATGALFGRDVLVNLDARATFQDGVASQGCGSCDDTNPCTTDACNAGSCTHTPVANGSACDDHNGCTTSDSCQNGACVGGSNVVCQPSNSCHSAGVCDPATGSCSNPPKPDGTACGSNACSPNDHCQGGSCVAGPSTTCMASDACHLAGTCNPSTGVCSNPPAPAGSACGDSNVCTGIEQCDGSGSCVPGIPPTVDDGNPCTIDICDPVLGVIHTPAPSDTSCSDSNACTLGDHCDGAGACVAGTPQTCTSDNACQAAACNPAVGCVTTPIAAGTPCDSDMNQCNGISTCDGAGSCVAGTPPNCTSNDPCMVPSCEPTTGCTLTRAPNGTAGCAPTFEPPPLDQTVSERFSATTAFLYSGTSPVQTGVAPGTIIEKRVAVIRGRVLDADGTTPRAGATVRVLQHPEYGQTLSRDNGEFDLAVNGGAHYVVDISLTGYLPVQRRADVRRWQNWSNLDDVVLTHPVSSPDLFVAASPTAQLVRGIVTPAGEDADGARQAVVLFPENTHATNYAVPDGTPLELQITEFTRGVSGAQRMPGELPASSGYTYAFSIQMPAAAAAGVQDVQFDRDIPIYVDNFTHYPVGEIVPLGYYDRAQGVWTAQQNGRIIKILGVAGGIATVDVTGDGLADSGSALLSLGITDSELQALATNYGAGRELWRVAVRHFSDYDLNWGFGPPLDAKEPPDLNLTSETLSCPGNSTQPGSIIGCESRTLGENLPIVGTPYTLHYDSTRAEGFKERILIPLTDDRVLPPSLVRIKVEVDVAGRVLTSRFAAPVAPNSYITGTWDGKDAYGRPVQGSIEAKVRVGYEYRAVSTQSTGGFGGPPGSIMSGDRVARTFTFWKEGKQPLFRAAAAPLGFGGWTIDVHHLYDNEDNLFLGTGERRTAASIGEQIDTVAGGGGNSGEGASAVGAFLGDIVTSATEAADGTLYVAAFSSAFGGSGRVIRKISTDNHVTTILGLEPKVTAVDGMPALHARLNPLELALGPDGSIYFTTGSTNSSDNFIWRITPDPVPLLKLVAGVGPSDCFETALQRLPSPAVQAPDCGDLGPALSAHLRNPHGLTVSGDGTIYFLDRALGIRLRSIAGGTIQTLFGDGIENKAIYPREDGQLFILREGDRLLRLDPSGSAEAVKVWVPPPGSQQDATNNSISAVWCEAASAFGGNLLPQSDGTFLATCPNTIVRAGSSGLIARLYGSPTANQGSGDGGPALRAGIVPRFMFGRRNGDVIAFDQPLFPQLRSVHPVAASPAAGLQRVVSSDGSEIYEMDDKGRHLRTLSAHRGTQLLSFGYDPGSHQLTSITDYAGNVTTISRSGSSVTITAPFGQQTQIGLDPNGFLQTFANPNNEVTQFITGSTGLLSDMADPRGLAHHFEYDGATSGRLVLDKDSAPGTPGSRLAIGEFIGGWFIEHRSPEDRITNYKVDRTGKFPNRTTVEMRTTSYGETAERPTITEFASDGAQTISSSDGTKISVLSTAPDPRWGTRASFANSVRMDVGFPTTTHSMTRTATRSVTLAPGGDAFNVSSETQTTTVTAAGMPVTTATRVYAASPVPVWTTTSPTGRQTRSTMDALDRVTQFEILGSDPIALTPVQYHYDSRGRVDRVTQGSRVYTTSFDPSTGWVTSTSDPANLGVHYALRDANGRSLEIELPGGRTLEMSYDANGNVASIIPPNQPRHGFSYGSTDLLSVYTPPTLPAGTTATNYQYDLDGHAIHVVDPTTTTDFLRDDFGRVKQIINDRTRSYNYDAQGRLAAVSTNTGVDLTYTWDGSLLSSAAIAGPFSHRIDQTYDNFLRPITTTIDGGVPVTQSYDLDGLVASIGGLTVTRGNTGLAKSTAISNVSEAYTYNGFGEMVGHTLTGSATSWSVTYTRDAAGRIETKTEVIGGVTTSERYTYDSAGRLDEVFVNGATTPAESFTYDANGNRSDGTYDVQDRQLTQGTFAFTYTNNGERATKRDTTNGSQTNYYYDTTGNLLRVQRPAPALEVEYVIDGANRRVAKKLGATLKQGFLYAGSSIIAELDESGVVQSRFIYLGESHSPDLMVRGGVTYRFVKDVLGSPRLIVNAQSGMVAQRMDFDAWGNVVVDTAPGFQPFGFAGGLWDRDTGLVRFGARDYDPSSGRWMSKDGSAFGGGLNFYRYANADPVNYLDIDGHHPAVVALVIIAFVITYGTLLASDDAQIQAKVHPEAHNNPGAGLLLSVGMFPPVGALCGGGSTASRFVAAGESFSSDEAVIVRSIDPTKGEKIKDLLAEARQLHDETGLEHAIVSTHHGERYLVYGGESGISFNNLDVRRIIFHTHPMGYPNPSQADFAFLETLGQRSSWVLENKPIRFGVGP